MRQRILPAGVVAILLFAACSNAGSSKNTSSTIPKSAASTATSIGDVTKKLPVHAKGVTDTEIDTDAVITITNSPAGTLAPLADGIRAYFAMVNDTGGLYGRQLKLTKVHDDQLGNNAQTVTAALANDNAFATFGATSLFTGAPLLARANQPTFIWNDNPEFAGHNNFFADVGAICFTCASHFLPFIAKNVGATKVGIVAYGVAQESKDCAEGLKASIEQFYPQAQVVFFDDSLPFAAPLSADVTAMKNRGVQLVGTCVDYNESLTLGREMQRQGLNAVQLMPNNYNAQFVAQNAAPLENGVVYIQFVPFEAQPVFPEVQKLQQWTQKTNVPEKELTAYGWIIADEFVTGLKLAGPDFSQQKVIDSLNSLTAWTDNGFNPPIDWTKQHNDPTKDPTALSKLDCGSYVQIKSGKFVPVWAQPGKPFVCFNRSDPNVDSPQYLNFAPS
jgi:ABC-type branched-subunit amino acid transport system substrate-binding protein